MQYFFYILIIPFIYLNYKIINSDLKYKIIPNKLLLYLLFLIPFYYLYIYNNFPDINYIFFLLQILFTFIISFILYSFWVWAAWDAKYLLVLSLFIPYIWITPFIWNIAILTILYLFWYFIYFYLAKILFNKKYRKYLFSNIKQNLSVRWSIYKLNKWWKIFFTLLKWLVIFLMIFVSIRLTRFYLFNSFFEESNNINVIFKVFEEYNIYLIFFLIWAFVWWFYLFRLFINKISNYISNKFKINIEKIWNVLISILATLLIGFLIYEFSINSKEISYLLFRIFTLYLWIYIFIQIIIYSYKITFWISETEYIKISELKEWIIIDKKSLNQIIWKQIVLGAFNNEKWLLYPNPSKYFLGIKNPIDKKDVYKVKKYIKIVNNYYKENIVKWITEINDIQILKTIPFGYYIFIWFIITFIFKNQIIIFIFNYIIIFLSSFS